jgi:hypothetical protein
MISVAMQQNNRSASRFAEAAISKQSRVSDGFQGIAVGLLLSTPLWALIGGVIYVAYRLFV